MDRLLRMLRHRWFDERDARRAVSDEALARIEAQVADSERGHGGEIAVVVEGGLPLSYLWRGLSARDRAVMLFGKMRVWDTERNNGVLIYLLLAEHSIEIVADRGLNRHVEAAQWAAIIRDMQGPLRQGRYEEGLRAAVAAVDALLTRHFPRGPGDADRNELMDAPIRR